MGDQSPHLLSITVLGCFLVVSMLAVAALTGGLVVVGLALLALILDRTAHRSRGSDDPVSVQASRPPVTRRGRQGRRQ